MLEPPVRGESEAAPGCVLVHDPVPSGSLDPGAATPQDEIEERWLYTISATAVPGAELIKGTGGPRCMSRPIYR